ncbi:MAG TPA: TetR/AcrR family transcriptional regulator [Anaerolineales bacterium]|jgi:AcrR family transcriptional regulator
MDSGLSIDRRIIRTKIAIRSALLELIDEKGFESLSVRDITTRANINRGTFYLHYRDKFDLLERTEAEFVQSIEKLILKSGPINLSELDDTDKPPAIVVSIFEYLKENATLVRAILRLEGDLKFQTRIKKVLEKNLKIGFLPVINFLVPFDYLTSYVISAHLGVVQMWLQRGCVESPHEMARILSKLSVHGPIHAISLKPG